MLFDEKELNELLEVALKQFLNDLTEFVNEVTECFDNPDILSIKDNLKGTPPKKGSTK